MKQKKQRVYRIWYIVKDIELGDVETCTGDIMERDLSKYDWMKTEFNGVRAVEVTS